MATEADFKAKVLKRLKTLGPDCYFFIKEAKALRGIPDVIGCYRGRFFAWELKRSRAVAESARDGHALQKYHVSNILRAGGVGRVVYPENFEECWKELVT